MLTQGSMQTIAINLAPSDSSGGPYDRDVDDDVYLIIAGPNESFIRAHNKW